MPAVYYNEIGHSLSQNKATTKKDDFFYFLIFFETIHRTTDIQ